MPVFLITYTTPRDDHTTTTEVEWITDASYDRDRACRAFEHRFPGAAVIHCAETD